MIRFSLTLVFLAISVATGQAQEKTVKRQPNIVLILADDFGYECVAANGGGSYKTPNLDKLAAAGVRFEHCFVQPLCTPTRLQLMTGQSNKRNYVRWAFLPPDSLTFAQLFRRAGYATAMIGKWQLGVDPKLPQLFGFDEYNLWQHTRRGSRYVNPSHDVNGKQVDLTAGEYGPDHLNDFAIDFVRRKKNEPFLLYYPLTLTHGPYTPTPGSPDYDPKAKSENAGADKKHFGGMVTYMDALVGKLIDEIDRLGLKENTLILFVGDNGTGVGISSLLNGMLVAGGKGSTTIAGMRVPLIARWPGNIPQGRICGDLIESTDFFPTICAAANVPIPKDAVLDGRNFLPQLQGAKGEPRSFYHSWFWAHPTVGSQPREFVANHRYKLYASGEFFAYGDDPAEKSPLAKMTPEVEAIRAELSRALDLYKNIRDVESPKNNKQ